MNWRKGINCFGPGQRRVWLTNVRLFHAFMNRLAYFFLSGAVTLVGCSHDQGTFEPSSAKPVALQDPTMREIMAGYDFLHDLHEHNRIPGDAKDMHGDPVPVNMVIQQPSRDVTYPFSWTFGVVLTGQAGFTNWYTVGRESKSSDWKLERAWRVDTNGVTIKEWQLK